MVIRAVELQTFLPNSTVSDLIITSVKYPQIPTAMVIVLVEIDWKVCSMQWVTNSLTAHNQLLYLMSLRPKPTIEQAEDLETLLIEPNESDYDTSMHDFQELYIKNEVLDKATQATKKSRENGGRKIADLRARVNRLKKSHDQSERSSHLLQNRIHKVKEVYTINKILMMQKVVKMERERESLQKKQSHYMQSREEQNQRRQKIRGKTAENLERVRLKSLSETKLMKEQVECARSHTTEQRKRIGEIKSECTRRRIRARKIQQYKLQRAKNNYAQKLEGLTQDVTSKEKKMKELDRLLQSQKGCISRWPTVKQMTANSVKNGPSFFATETPT